MALELLLAISSASVTARSATGSSVRGGGGGGRGTASISYYDMMECRLSSRVFSSLNGWVGLVLGGDGVNVFYAYRTMVYNIILVVVRIILPI